MNLKEQLKSIVETSKKKDEEEKRKREYPEPVLRTEKDLEIIDNYLRNLLISGAAKPPFQITFRKMFGCEIKKDYICIDCESESMKYPTNKYTGRIVLSNGTHLKIYNEDMKRFCEQHKLTLAYLIYKGEKWERGAYYNCEFSANYCGTSKTISYLIEVG